MAGLHSNSELPPLPEIEGVELRLCRKFVGYAVGNDGSLWSCCPRGSNTRPIPWHQRIVGTSRLGYRETTIKDYVTGKNGIRGIAPLVCEAFHGPCPEGMECCHNDSVRDNDVADNLRWDTHKNNMQDAVRLGHMRHNSHRFGEQNHLTKFSDSTVMQIKQLIANGVGGAEIARMLKVTPQTVCDIKKGRSRRRVTIDG